MGWASRKHSRQGYPITDHRSQKTWTTYYSTHQIIDAIKSGTFPKKAMFTFHPQRWTSNPISWTKELVWQNLKNQVKYFIINKKYQ